MRRSSFFAVATASLSVLVGCASPAVRGDDPAAQADAAGVGSDAPRGGGAGAGGAAGGGAGGGDGGLGQDAATAGIDASVSLDTGVVNDAGGSGGATADAGKRDMSGSGGSGGAGGGGTGGSGGTAGSGAGGSGGTGGTGGAPAVHSPCLDAANVVKVTDVADGMRLVVPGGAKGTSFDLRGVDVRAVPETHLIDFDSPSDICVTGGSAIATYPDGFVVNWDNVKHGTSTFGPYDEGGFHTSHPQSGTTVFDRIYIEGVEDGLMIARLAGDASQKWELRSSYLKNVLDDSVENDGYRTGKVIDVLAEGVHMFYSARGSSELAHSVLIQDSVIGFGCKRDDRTGQYSGAGACPANMSTQRMFKLSTLEPTITIENTIIHHPAVSLDGPSRTCLPASGHYTNVTIVWTAAIKYPCGDLPGVTVTTNESVYTNARGAWLARHGCNADGTGCAFLRR